MTNMLSDAKTILIVGDAAVSTGFARVVRKIGDQLAQTFRVHQLAIGYLGDPHTYPWPLYPAFNRGDVYGRNRLPELIKLIRPSVIFIMNSLWTVASYLDQLDHAEASDIPVIAYCPVEEGGFDPQVVLRLKRLAKLVVYTDFARGIVRECFVQVGHPVRDDFIEVIPHGVDTSVFHPLKPLNERGARSAESRISAKNDLLQADIGSEAFFVLNANRNQPRKLINLTVQAFSIFCRGKHPDVKLYLHMGLRDVGWDIKWLAKRHGIQDRLILSTDSASLPQESDEVLNLIFNACDIGVSTAAAEGWGLTTFEHAATGAPQIVPRHSSYEELWSDSGILVDPVLTLSTPDGQFMLDYHLVSPQAVAEALDRLYSDPLQFDLASAAAFRNATKREYQWQTICDRWNDTFRPWA